MGNTTNSLADKSRLRQMIDSYGVPRMIITGFLLLMFVLVPFAAWTSHADQQRYQPL